MFFLLGRGRSGTTLLASHLNGIPGIVVAPECLFIMNLHGKYGSATFNGRAEIARFCDDVYLESRINNWSFRRSELEEYLVANLPRGAGFAEICSAVYQAHAHFSGHAGVVVVGDKNPHYALMVDRLVEIFPDARFVYLVRDPRANVASYRRVRFDYKAVGVLAARWNIYNRAILSGLRNARWLKVRFEDFVAAPEQWLQQIASFLGVEGRAAGQQRAVTGYAATREWHARLGKPIDPGVLSEWRQELSPRQQRQIEAICGKLMREFGYEPEQPQRGRLASKPFYALLGWATTAAERLLFKLPLSLRSATIAGYRRLTATQ